MLEFKDVFSLKISNYLLQFFMKTFTYTLTNQTINSLIDFSIFKQEKNILIQIFCGDKKIF